MCVGKRDETFCSFMIWILPISESMSLGCDPSWGLLKVFVSKEEQDRKRWLEFSITLPFPRSVQSGHETQQVVLWENSSSWMQNKLRWTYFRMVAFSITLSSPLETDRNMGSKREQPMPTNDGVFLVQIILHWGFSNSVISAYIFIVYHLFPQIFLLF